MCCSATFKSTSKLKTYRTIFYFGLDLAQVVLHPDSCSVQFTEKSIHLARNSDDEFLSYFNSEEASSIATDINQHLFKIPPSRLILYRSASQTRAYLVLSLHHAIFDGISLPVILSNLEAEYLGRRTRPSAPLIDVLKHVVSQDLGLAQKFWKKHFSGFSWEAFLSRYASSAQTSIISTPFRTPLSVLQAKAAAQKVTLQALLMNAFAHCLAAHVYGIDDVVFGVCLLWKKKTCFTDHKL